jgi:hypothetical protein
MNNALKLFSLLLLAGSVNAAIISRTYNYTDGNTMSANENNTNENTVYNEINGNLSAANILDGSITNADLADTQITATKFAASVQSTFTLVSQQMMSYRRPNLTFVSVTTVDVEANSGTSNQTCVMFPDERRCVTENTGSTSVNRRFIITEAASNSGTKNSGLRTGYVETANTKYALYAWKVSDVATDFVLVADTITVSQANYAALNTFYGTNAWVYLGTIWNGNGQSGSIDIASFKHSGPRMTFTNSNNAAVLQAKGIVLTFTAGATSLTYTYTAGFASGQIPSNIIHGSYIVSQAAPGGNTALIVKDAAGTNFWGRHSVLSGQAVLHNVVDQDITEGIQQTDSSSTSLARDIFLYSYWDAALTNPYASPY